jgi:hypothetical protein
MFDERRGWFLTYGAVHAHSLMCAATQDHRGRHEKIAPVSVGPLTA